MTQTEMLRSARDVAARMPGTAAVAQAVHQGDKQPEHVRHSEGPVARAIEEYTARIPSDVYLWAAGASILGAAAFKLSGSRHNALFVGQWVAPFLILGLYNKLVKVAGTDRTDRPNPKLSGGH